MTERRFIIVWTLILLGVMAGALLLMRAASGQTTAPTTATATFNDTTGEVVSVQTIPPPRRTPSRPPIIPPPNVATITLSAASLAFDQATKAPQSVTATGPAGVAIASHDNLSFVDTGAPTGTGSLTATFTPNATYSSATANISGSASFTAGTLTAILPVSLKAGSGTVTPPTGGNPPGAANEPAVADWAMPPYMSNPTIFSVAAFHIGVGGVGSVQFKVDNTVIGTATPSINAAVCPLPLYHVACPALAAGTHTLSATAYPVAGKPVVLQPYQFSIGLPVVDRYISASGNDATGDGSQAKPFKTIARAATGIVCDGATIHVGAGSFMGDTGAVTTTKSYLNIVGAGTSTVITGFASTVTKFIHFDNCWMQDIIPNRDNQDPRFMWYSRCMMKPNDISNTQGNGRFWEAGFTGWANALSNSAPVAAVAPWTTSKTMVQTAFATDCDIQYAMFGWNNGRLARNVTIAHIGAFSLNNAWTAINTTSSDVGPQQYWNAAWGPPPHGDINEMDNCVQNVLMYGCTGIDTIMARGIVTGDSDVTNVALIQCNITINGAVGLQLGPYNAKLTNCLIKDSTFDSGVILGQNTVFTDVVLDNVKFPQGAPAMPSGVTVR